MVALSLLAGFSDVRGLHRRLSSARCKFLPFPKNNENK